MKECIKKKKSFLLRKQIFFFSLGRGSLPLIFSTPSCLLAARLLGAGCTPRAGVPHACLCQQLCHGTRVCKAPTAHTSTHPAASAKCQHGSANDSQDHGQHRQRISAILPLKSENHGPYISEAIRLVFCPNCCSLEINRAQGDGVSGSQDVLLGFDLVSALHGPPFCSWSLVLKAHL